MELYDAIEKRRTIRVYKSRATEAQLRKIILAGTKAPSARNRQPWEFIIVEDRQTLDRLADLKYRLNSKVDPDQGRKQASDARERAALEQKRSFDNASIVAVCNEAGWERSVWLCIENMSLSAVAEGLGSGIVLYWGEEKKEVERALGIPEDYELTAVLKIGEPAEEGFPRDKNPSAPRREEFSWLHRNRFGDQCA
ncbi:MAG: nitroreductase family protein [Desulfatiglandaceae bacterium]